MFKINVNYNFFFFRGYDPAQFRDLPVSSEISDIFKFIERYQPQTIELEFKLRPFIPDYIPSIGDIDAFLKVNRPDGKEDNLGFIVVDEPSSNQSDPHVLDLFFRTLSKQSTNEVRQPSAIKSVESNNTKAIDSWIRNISALQKNKPVQTVNYQRTMPNIDGLMQVWSPEFEELLKEVSLPSPELNVDLNTYTDIICSILDIPVYKSRTQSIHVLMTLFSEFKNSEVSFFCKFNIYTVNFP
jgi:intraflagellar transport protein 46